MSKPAIICVDDESVVLNSLKIQLKNEFQDAYLYEFAESVEEALEIIGELQAEEISIVAIISDWLMPGTKGDEFLIHVHRKLPKVTKILLTGQANLEAIERASHQANLLCCIYKPWDGKELIETIKSGLEKS